MSTTIFTHTDHEGDEYAHRTGIELGGITGTSITLSSIRGTKRDKTSKNGIATALHNLERKCKQLKPYSSFKKADLPEDAFHIFLEVSELATQVGNTPQYADYLRITSDVFGDQIPSTGDTVADFFLGCSYTSSKAGSRIGCEPLCAGNLPRENYTTEDFCDTHVGIYSSGSLGITYSPVDRSDSIRIYHSVREFTLSNSEISTLRKLGVTKIIRIYTGGSVQVSSTIALPSASGNRRANEVGKSHHASRAQSAVASRKQREGDGGMSTGGWAVAAVVLFILLIIIIFLVIWAFRSSGVADSDSITTDQRTSNCVTCD